MAMTDAELDDLEKKLGMAAAGYDVGKVNALPLVGEVRRLRRELATVHAQLASQSSVTFTAGEAVA